MKTKTNPKAQRRTGRGTAKERRPGFLKSADKTLDVLELLADRGPLGVTDVAKARHIGISTAHRILTTLKKRGFAVQKTRWKDYSLGGKLARLAR